MKEQRAEMVRKILFRQSSGSKCDFPTLSKRTGIPVHSLRRYCKNPENIPLDRVILIADAMDTKPADVGYMITGRIVK